MGSAGYDRFAQPYDVSRVLDLQTLRLNQTAYDEYSPLYLPISFAITYTLAWTIPPALLTQTIFIYGPVVYRAIRGRPRPGDYVTDIHSKLMKRYAEVPLWWHGAAFVAGLGLATGAALVCPASRHRSMPANELTGNSRRRSNPVFISPCRRFISQCCLLQSGLSLTATSSHPLD